MLLPPHERELFFKLHRALVFFVNQRLKVILNKVASPEEFAALSPEVRVKFRDALNANLDLIESFAAENPAHRSDEELDIVRSWRHLVSRASTSVVQLQKLPTITAINLTTIYIDDNLYTCPNWIKLLLPWPTRLVAELSFVSPGARHRCRTSLAISR